ncbi:hypothetical protein FSARC_4875 [Fusarium sarcochroum]|uniref:AB hydrolase-1 domain-containing protein n=1 Tax=Fusarium sarcochroum TaxID=1208366 RepID=A0A8H4XA46_9HYPO|nr:hypothetical protein FSARC_4875 [Fusarium sarcochroum]
MMRSAASSRSERPMEGWPSHPKPPDPRHNQHSYDVFLPQPETQTSEGENREAICTRTTFFVNIDWRMGSTLATATNIVGQMYVECLEPVERHYPHPIVLIHGDFHTGQTTKPDGQPGWASFFLNKGFQVYIVDLPPTGRSNFLTNSHYVHREIGAKSHSITAAVVESELTAPGIPRAPNVPLRHERAHHHNKWPGTGRRGDPIFAKYCASLATLHLNKVERQSLAQNALQALLQHIGKAILIGEGTGGNMTWLATDVEPSLVAAAIAIEPAGPPFGTACPKVGNPYRLYRQFIQREEGTRIYGLTEIPLTYDPPAHPHEGFDPPQRDPLDIVHVIGPGDTGECYMQRSFDDPTDLSTRDIPPPEDVRQLINIKKVPNAIITAHASSHTVYDWATVSFMLQAGVNCAWIRLDKKNIFGNGHLMFLETNSDEVAQVLLEWILNKALPKAFLGSVSKPITPPEWSDVDELLKEAEPRKRRSVESQSSQLSGQQTQYLSSQSTDAETSQSQPLRTPQKQSAEVSGCRKNESSGQRSIDSYFKRTAPSSGQTTVSYEGRTSSPRPPSTSAQVQKRPRLVSSDESSHKSTSSPSLPSSNQSSTQKHTRAHHAIQQQSQGPVGEHSVPDIAMLRPTHPGGGPSQLRQQANTDIRSPMGSPALSHPSQLQASRSLYTRPSNLYEHLPIGQPVSSTQRDNQRNFNYNNTHTTARFERQTGTAEESIAATAMYNQGRVGSGLAHPTPMAGQQHRSPMMQTQHQSPHLGYLNQSPALNFRGGLQSVPTSTSAGDMIMAGVGPPCTPLPPSTLGSHVQSPFGGYPQMTPPSPSPAPRPSSNPPSYNVNVGSPAMPGFEQTSASKWNE